MRLTREQWKRLSGLIDQAMEIPAAQRRAWIAQTPGLTPELGELLQQMLEQGAEVQTTDLLGPLPKIALELRRPVPIGLQPGDTVGPYRLQRQLGHGGMGTVWLAERTDGLLKRPVALKLPSSAVASDVLAERFERERDILAGLAHPNIARLYDAGIAASGQPYLALEYVDGIPITQFCDGHCLPVHGRLELFLQVLAAVQYAHSQLVIHRDLKPSNILVTSSGQVVLLDFGIAKLIVGSEAKETALTLLGGRALTPEYASPEQILGQPLSTASDVYSLGVVLYELLTGERPYRLKRDSRGALEEAIVRGDPVPPSRAALSAAATGARATTGKRLIRILSGDLDTIATKALKKSPAERYAGANAFAEDVTRYLRGDVVLARPDTLAYRARKFAQRNWIALAAAGVLVLALAGGFAATYYEARVASEQRDAARQANLRLLTQTAAARFRDADVPAALGIILEVLPHRGGERPYTPEALSVFQQARAADAQVLALSGHTDRVISGAFSPDGRYAVTASYDKTARIWDAATGRQLRMLVGHTDSVISAAFSADGRRVVTASYDRTARIWDAATGEQIGLLKGHTDRVARAAFSPDGRRIVTASHDKTARIWDAETGRQLRTLSGHTHQVVTAAFSADGRRIVTASTDKSARVWDAATGAQIGLLAGHTEVVMSAAFSPNGRWIATASLDKTARIWDAATGRELRTLGGHTDIVESAAFSPDGRYLVTASDDKTARIWDADTGQPLRQLLGHTDRLEEAAFSPDGQRIITVSRDRTARLWRATADQQIGALTGHGQWVVSAAFSPEGRYVVTASLDRTARIWDAATGEQLRTLGGHLDAVATAAFSPDGGRVVTASMDKTAGIWEAATGRLILRLTGHSGAVLCAAFSPDGRRIVTGSQDRTARIWDAATGQSIDALSGHKEWVITAAFSADGRYIVTGSYDRTARLWDAATGKLVRVLAGHADLVESAAFSRDGRYIVTASDDRTARIWEVSTGRQLMLLQGHTGVVSYAAFSPDGRRVVTGSRDGSARIWDAATGQLVKLLAGHTDQIETAAFSPDGERVVTASHDNTARIWDARAPAVAAQIGWTEAAQFDPLPSSERFQLGLPPLADVRRWPADRSECDESAAAPYDPDRRAPGVMLEQLAPDPALEACARKPRTRTDQARSLYQHGRALVANGEFAAARRDFEDGLAQGYRAAAIELGMLLSRQSSGALDVPRAISLYERAWADGVTIAAFELGSLYEHGVGRTGGSHEYSFSPDEARAWFWYRKGAAAAEPNSLARLAEKDDAAASAEDDPARKSSYLQQSFKYYAAAAQRARNEDWPSDAWRSWRYRRASLARLLARRGMLPEVSDLFDQVREQYALPHATIWDRLTGPVALD